MFLNLLEKIRNNIVPIISYNFVVQEFDFYITEPSFMSFDGKSLKPSDYFYIYQKIFEACVDEMNEKNQRIILDFFANLNQRDGFWNDFKYIVLTNYIDNLNKNQQKDLSDTGLIDPFYPCQITNDCTNIVKSLCVGSIKIHIEGENLKAKIHWNKFSTITSLIPVLICVCTYEYFMYLSCDQS